MDHTRSLLPLTCSSEDIQIEDTTALLRARNPLSNLASNAQTQTLAVFGPHYDQKGDRRGSDRSPLSVSSLPSEPQRSDMRSVLELRRQAARKRRQLKFGRNPIVESPQYRAYRDRQTREGCKDEDSKWPDVLEDAFLDALIELPQMQRRKYSYHGKPHGRNELITEYLWIAYQQSLPPGAPLDDEMRRTRKQVSSHIQVLKGFLRDHPARHLLFPKPKPAKNGFQDSFKDDPCLRALSEGRLPGKQSHSHEQPQIKPTVFWIILKADGDDRTMDLNGGEGILHHFSKLSPYSNNRANLDSIHKWQDRFPNFSRLQAREELDYPIIHMDVSLDLLSSPPSQSSQLLSRTMLSIPPATDLQSCEWQIVTTLEKPPELCGDARHDGRLKDPYVDQAAFAAQVSSRSEFETLINISFPAAQFAYIFACLVGIQQQYEDEMEAQSQGQRTDPTIRPAREYIEKVSMYQELGSQSAPGAPFVTRAVFIWTFREAREGESNHTTWRYLDAVPPQQRAISPPLQPINHIPTSMNDSHSPWSKGPLLKQHNNMLDSHVHRLATPPQTSGLQSPISSSAYSFSPQAYDIQDEDLSFSSNTMLGNGSTVANTATNIENFLAHVNLAEYEQANTWQLPVDIGFDADPAWAHCAETATNVWSDTGLQGLKPSSWTDETSYKHHQEWPTSHPTDNGTYVEQDMEERLMPWIYGHQDLIMDNITAFEHGPDSTTLGEIGIGIGITMGGSEDSRIQQESMNSHLLGSHNSNSQNHADVHNMEKCTMNHAEDIHWNNSSGDRFAYS